MTHSVLSKGIWPVERVILAYIAFTFLLMFCWWNSLVDPLLLFLTRGKALLLMAVMWAVYRWRPCRLTHLLRVSGLMLTLSLFYPDTYEINRMLPNLDHIFAGIEQLPGLCQLFPSDGCHIALLFLPTLPGVPHGLLCAYQFFLYLLFHLRHSASYRTTVLLSGSRHRQDCCRHIPQFNRLFSDT